MINSYNNIMQSLEHLARNIFPVANYKNLAKLRSHSIKY